jgi:hypothetical protein
VDWLHRTFNAPTSPANDVAWNRGIGARGNLPNLNLAPDSPAYAYQGGAPVTNYRGYQRVGVLEVPVE